MRIHWAIAFEWEAGQARPASSSATNVAAKRRPLPVTGVVGAVPRNPPHPDLSWPGRARFGGTARETISVPARSGDLAIRWMSPTGARARIPMANTGARRCPVREHGPTDPPHGAAA